MSLRRLSRHAISEMNVDKGNLGIKNSNVAADMALASFLSLPGYSIQGLSWRDDGTQFYTINNAGVVRVYTAVTPWSLKGATLTTTVAGFPTYATDIYVSPNGQYLYLGGGNTLLQYQLNTPWSISSTTLISTRTTTQMAIPEITGIPSFTFSYDGTRLFIASRVGSRILAGLELSTPFMIATARSSGLYIPNTPSGITFDTTGSRMYTLDAGASSTNVSQYTLSVPWKPGSATLVNNFSISNIFGLETSPRGIYFKDDGTAFFIAGAATSSIYKFNLNIPWHVHSHYDNFRYVLETPKTTQITGLGLSSNGAYLYYSNVSSIFQTQLSSPNNVGQAQTASNTNLFTFIGDSPYVNDFQLSNDGTKLYLSDAANRIRQLNLSDPYRANTASGPVATSIAVGANFYLEQVTQSNVYTFGLASFNRGHPYIQLFEMSSPSSLNTLVSYPGSNRNTRYARYADMYMKPDGLKTYVAAYRTTYLNESYLAEYDNDIPFNVGSMQFVTQIGLSTGWPSSAISSLYISPDGGNLYFSGTTSRRIYQYELTTPWSLATATSKNMVMNPGDVDPASLQFSPDGSNLYVMCRGAAQIRQFPLNESWNILSNSTVFIRNYTKELPTTVSIGGNFSTKTSLAQSFDIGDGSNAYLQYIGVSYRVNDSTYPYTPAYILNVRFDNLWQIATANVSVERTIGSSTWSYLGSTPQGGRENIPIVDFLRIVEQGKRAITGIPRGLYEPIQLQAEKLANTYDVTSRMPYLKLDTRDTECTGMFIDPSGMNLYFSNSVAVRNLVLNEPYDIFSANLYPRVEQVSRRYIVPFQYLVWDLTARISQSLSTNTLENEIKGFQFSSNGQYLYVTGSKTRGVDRYTLGTMWDLSTATLDTKIYSTRGLENTPEAVTFKNDGTYMYVAGSSNNNVQEFLLSAEWDHTTASRQRSFNFGSTVTGVTGLTFRDNGGSMFVSSSGTSTRGIFEFNLTEEWNSATAQYLNRSHSIGELDAPSDLYIPSSGNAIFTVTTINDVAAKLPLGEAWNVKTVILTSGTDKISLSNFEESPSGVVLSSSGRKMLLSGEATKTLRTLAINSATDISTAQLTGEIKSFPEVTINSLTGATLSKDERSIYVADGGLGRLYQYDIAYSPTRKP